MDWSEHDKIQIFLGTIPDDFRLNCKKIIESSEVAPESVALAEAIVKEAVATIETLTAIASKTLTVALEKN